MNNSDLKILFSNLKFLLKTDPQLWSEIEVEQFLNFAKIEFIQNYITIKKISGSIFLKIIKEISVPQLLQILKNSNLIIVKKLAVWIDNLKYYGIYLSTGKIADIILQDNQNSQLEREKSKRIKLGAGLIRQLKSFQEQINKDNIILWSVNDLCKLFAKMKRGDLVQLIQKYQLDGFILSSVIGEFTTKQLEDQFQCSYYEVERINEASDIIISYKYILERQNNQGDYYKVDEIDSESSLLDKNTTPQSTTPSKMDSGVFKMNSEVKDDQNISSQSTVSEFKQNMAQLQLQTNYSNTNLDSDKKKTDTITEFRETPTFFLNINEQESSSIRSKCESIAMVDVEQNKLLVNPIGQYNLPSDKAIKEEEEDNKYDDNDSSRKKTVEHEILGDTRQILFSFQQQQMKEAQQKNTDQQQINNTEIEQKDKTKDKWIEQNKKASKSINIKKELATSILYPIQTNEVITEQILEYEDTRQRSNCSYNQTPELKPQQYSELGTSILYPLDELAHQSQLNKKQQHQQIQQQQQQPEAGNSVLANSVYVNINNQDTSQIESEDKIQDDYHQQRVNNRSIVNRHIQNFNIESTQTQDQNTSGMGSSQLIQQGSILLLDNRSRIQSKGKVLQQQLQGSVIFEQPGLEEQISKSGELLGSSMIINNQNQQQTQQQAQQQPAQQQGINESIILNTNPKDRGSGDSPSHFEDNVLQFGRKNSVHNIRKSIAFRVAAKDNIYANKTKQKIKLLEDTTLKLKFDPFDFKIVNQIKIKIKSPDGQQGKDKIIGISGCTIGRGEKNTFSFPDESTISFYHAQIYFEKGQFYIIDLGSRSGTFVLIKELKLQENMQITFGHKVDIKIDKIIKTPEEGTMIISFERPPNQNIKKIQLKPDQTSLLGRDEQKQ